ncbi:MAG: hypothetical protein MUF71_04560 [Candidatus Kapabacteria bacterium]|jgi:outer membrane protein OmpA-like peptidoglycan-associated protein|nr:hypothetical protein [Candidatus Kapabacteria bacterium]
MKSLFPIRSLCHIALSVLILCGIQASLLAQMSDSLRLKDYLPPDAESPYFTRFGLTGGVNLVTQTPNFNSFGSISPPVGSTLLYPSGTGIGFAAGALVEFPFSFSSNPERNVFGLSLRLSYSTYNAKSSLINTEIAYDKTTDQPTSIPIEYSVEGRFNFLSFEPALTYRTANGRLVLYAGVKAGLALSSTFFYIERLQDPRYVFLNGNNQQTTGLTSGETSDKIPFAQAFNLAPTVGIGYEIPLNADGTVLLQPEGFWSPGLFSLANGLDWKISGFRVGASLKYSPFRTIRPEMTPEVQEKISKLRRYDSLLIVERSQNAARLKQTDSLNKAIAVRLAELKKVGLSATVTSIKGIDERGMETATPALAVEEFRAWRSVPLLGAVFFDNNSAILPARYRRVQSASRARYVFPDVSELLPTDVYRHILNIIGKRLSENPAATIEIIGHKSTSEAEGLDERRAQAISDYLQDVWRVPVKRIEVRKAVNTTVVAGAESNQYVEMSSPQAEIFAPLTSDFVTTSVNPPVLRFGLEVNTGAGIKQWTLEISQFINNESVALKEVINSQSPPNVVEWNIADVQSNKPRSNQDITVQLSVTDITNRNADAPIANIPVKLVSLEEKELRNTADSRWEETLLGQSPLFGKDLTETTLAALKSSVGSAKTLALTAFIYEVDKGKESAMPRAKELAKLLNKPDVTVNIESALRIGQQTVTPEEIFYGQAVMVRVMTAIGK